MKAVNGLIKHIDGEFSQYVSSFLPREAVVPLNQMSAKKYRCLVSEGETVREGQVIASPLKEDSNITSVINSPFPGVVTGIVPCFLPNGRKGEAIKISVKGAFTHLGHVKERRDWHSYTDDDILKVIYSNGVINTFGKSNSLIQQIVKARRTQGLFLVVRMFDDDISRGTESFIAKTFTDEVSEGASIIARLMQAQGIIFLNSKHSHYSINNDFVKDHAVLCVDVDNLNYPAGFRQNIISTVKKYVKNTQTEYFNGLNFDSVFVDSLTAYNVYRAVVLGEPVTDVFVQVSGDSLDSRAMFKVKIGTPISDLVRQCGGLVRNPGKIVINGMLTGYSVDSLDVPVSKLVKSVMFVPGKNLYNQTFVPCIHCGRCRSVCPESLMPDLIAENVIKHYANLYKESAVLCSACNLCSSVCPSRIPLGQIVSLLGNGGLK